jgi:hypothetical protein
MAVVINLVVEAFLFGDDPKNFNKEIDGSDTPEERSSLWRKRGSLGKLHNIVYFITRTTQRIRKFAELQKSVVNTAVTLDGEDKVYALERDGGIRWNSTYLMIKRGMKLERAINLFCFEMPELALDKLTTDDWADLAKIMEILEPFWELTIQLQGCVSKYGHEGLLQDVVIAMEQLLAHLRDHQVRYEFAPNDHQIKNCIKAAIDKMNTYMNLTRKSSAWAAAIVMHPGSKWKEFESSPNWKKKDELAAVKRSVKTLWENQYRKDGAVSSNGLAGPAPKKRRIDIGHRNTVFENPLAEDGRLDDPTKPPDDYMRYCRDPLDDIEDGREWWKAREHIYPDLVYLAWDMLAIPAMSSECERTFSKAGYQLTPQRTQLGNDILEASECLKQWLTMEILQL